MLKKYSILTFIFALFLSGCANLKPLPEGTSYQGERHSVQDISFLADLTYVDQQGQRHVEQEIFDEVFSMIQEAKRFVLVDMFLYNDYQGASKEKTRALSEDLTRHLIAQKKRYPEIKIVVISDPINTIYGGKRSTQFERLQASGIQLVLTDLSALHDSNALYSTFWRLFIQPFGNTTKGEALPNPFGEGRVSLRSYLSLLNFKANHRKLMIADQGNQLAALVTSANPHDGSSAHHNVAVKFISAAVKDLWQTEKAVMTFSGAVPPEIPENLNTFTPEQKPLANTQIQVLTEGKIKHTLLQLLDNTRAGDRIDLLMFYLSDRDVIHAFKQAQQRGVTIRMLLDPNKDAFGFEKNGIPNRQVAYELHQQGIPVRWCDTHGEQCHSKMLIVKQKNGLSQMLLGSANFTRRNLADLNLETDLAIYGKQNTPFFLEAQAYFDLLWHNDAQRFFSVAYEEYEDSSVFKRGLYRFMEATGMSTF